MVYQTIDEILQKAGTDMCAAEAHGIATGMLCIDTAATLDNWLAEVFAEQLPEADSLGILTALFEQTGALLASDDYGFDLLLPDDDDDQDERIEALRSWCLGFLFGVGYGQATDDKNRAVADWPGETREILKDIVEFTKMDISGDEASREEEEAALVEISEYLRAAVFLLRDGFGHNTGAVYH